jgi:hypothetical protein
VQSQLNGATATFTLLGAADEKRRRDSLAETERTYRLSLHRRLVLRLLFLHIARLSARARLLKPPFHRRRYPLTSGRPLSAVCLFTVVLFRPRIEPSDLTPVANVVGNFDVVAAWIGRRTSSQSAYPSRRSVSLSGSSSRTLR